MSADDCTWLIVWCCLFAGNLADFLQYSLQFNDTLDESLIWSFIADIAAVGGA